MTSIRELLKLKKVWVGIVLVVVVGYYGYKHFTTPAVAPRYVTANVERGTLTVTVGGTGQVAASTQLDIKPQISGIVARIPVSEGQVVKAGTTLIELNTADAYKAVRDAQLNLQSARLTLQKLVEPADQLSMTQAQNALDQATLAKTTAQSDLQKAYTDGYDAVANAFLDLPSAVAGLHDTLYANTFGLNTWDMDYFANAVRTYDSSVSLYQNRASSGYQAARIVYDKNFADYKESSRTGSTDSIESIINETYTTSVQVSDALKNGTDLIQFYKDKMSQNGQKPSATADTELTALNGYSAKINTDSQNLLTAMRTIENDKNAITTADQTIAEKTQSLAKLKAGANDIDIQSQQLAVKQREAALADAEDNLAKSVIRAPMDGIVAKINAKITDNADTGGAIVTMVTQQQMAQISLNEVDAAKIKVGQKVVLTFDAIDGLSLTGRVGEVDTVGTVTQGVVTYAVKIVFDTQDDRVKPGMSVNASIITNVQQDVLIVPSSAVQNQNNRTSVLVFNPPLSGTPSSQGVESVTPPVSQAVQVGISNDTETEITSGLKEGDQIVVRTITTAGAAAGAQAPSLFGGGGGGGGFRGAGRIGG